MNRLNQPHTKVDLAKENVDVIITLSIIFFIFVSVNDLGSYERYVQ